MLAIRALRPVALAAKAGSAGLRQSEKCGASRRNEYFAGQPSRQFAGKRAEAGYETDLPRSVDETGVAYYGSGRRARTLKAMHEERHALPPVTDGCRCILQMGAQQLVGEASDDPLSGV